MHHVTLLQRGGNFALLKYLMMTSLEGRMERTHANSKIMQVLVLRWELTGLHWCEVKEIVSGTVCADPGNS